MNEMQLPAYVSMTSNIVTAAIILALGTFFLTYFVRMKAVKLWEPTKWLPVIALIAGPVIAFLWWLVDFCINHSDKNPFAQEELKILLAILAIGAFVGIFAAVAFFIGLRFSGRKKP